MTQLESFLGYAHQILTQLLSSAGVVAVVAVEYLCSYVQKVLLVVVVVHILKQKYL
jgi:hypothetical protein